MRRYVFLISFLLICMVIFAVWLCIKKIHIKNYLKNEVAKAETFLKEEPKTVSVVGFRIENNGTQELKENYIDCA